MNKKLLRQCCHFLRITILSLCLLTIGGTGISVLAVAQEDQHEGTGSSLALTKNGVKSLPHGNKRHENALSETVPVELASKENLKAVKSSKNTQNAEESISKTAPFFQEIRGVITDGADGTPLPGVTVLIKGTTRGVVTSVNGEFRIEAQSGDILVISFIGYRLMEVQVIAGKTLYNLSIEQTDTNLQEFVIIGYGEQNKETLIGAVSQTSGEVLQRTGGVSNLGQALQGNLPGLIAVQSGGAPGDEQPQILIRGNNTWNGSGPLILVDGVERPEFFNNMDIGSVESVSVLKDASATAVFGSRGANGVIIVTTKRGKEGKAEIVARVSTTVKSASKLPGKMDAYDAIGIRNLAIERELSVSPQAWTQIIPQEIRQKYRTPANLEEAERYPNIDWQNYLFKDYAMAYNANISITGGTKFTKYFAAFDFQNEGDLFREFDNGRGYQPGFNPACIYPLRSFCFSEGSVFLVSGLCTTDFLFVKGWCLVWSIL